MTSEKNAAQRVIAVAKKLSADCDRVAVDENVFVYNPLRYARNSHELYLSKYGNRGKRAIWLGMNPGPFGMMQTGVPFGEVAAVRDFLQIECAVEAPKRQHPKRAIEGFSCTRSEISGRRLWGLVEDVWGTPESFFADNIVWNYCPLAFLDERGSNVTPDKLSSATRAAIAVACDRALDALLDIWQPSLLIGVGGYAERQLRNAAARIEVRSEHASGAGAIVPSSQKVIAQILHPSPASPRANRDWAGQVRAQLMPLSILPATAVSALTVTK